MRLFRRIASSIARTLLFGALLFGALSTGEVRASGLRVGIRVQNDVYRPLVPVSRNFRSCFRTDASGSPVLGLCAPEEPKGQKAPERAPAEKRKER